MVDDRFTCLPPRLSLTKVHYRGQLMRTEHISKFDVVCCLLAFTFCTLILVASAYPQTEPRQQRGLTFARANYARCHAIDKASPSPLKLAPPVRELHKRYPVESLEEAFGEGIVTGHPNMPEFRLDGAQIDDLISYLKWLEQ